MSWRSDHVAGAAFVALGVLVFALSDDLPFGRLSAPGAGMMPKVTTALMAALGIAVAAGGGTSTALKELNWRDSGHAAATIAITAVAIACYQALGFLITMSLLIFGLLVLIERRNIVRAACYSFGTTLLAYLLFRLALKAPLERGILGL